MASFALVKKENVVMSKRGDKRSQIRTTVDEYHSVEFLLPDVEFIYQFRIWNMSPQGMCVVVRKDSNLLKHLNVGDMIDLRYHPNDLKDPIVSLRTEIRHITKQEEGKFKQHSLVGLMILEKQSHGQ
jgi:hypothetical protein